MDFDTGIKYVLILLGIGGITLAIAMTVLFKWSLKLVNRTENIDKKRGQKYFTKMIRRNNPISDYAEYSDAERAQGYIYYYICCVGVVIVMVAFIIGFVLMN